MFDVGNKIILNVILVTGGTGFLGAVLIGQLIDQGQHIRAIYRTERRIPKALANHPQVTWVEADVLDFLALEEAFKGVKQVYHCAAKVSYHPFHHKSMHQINVEGTANVVNLCIDHGVRLVHVSSIAALGEGKNGLATTEDDMWEYGTHQSAYGIAKYESEMEVWRGFTEGLEGVIINPSLIIGHQAGSKGSGAIFALMNKGMRFYPGGSVGLVDVEDVANSMIQLMERTDITAERFIVSNVNMTHQEMMTRCSAYLGKPAPKKKATPFMLELAWRASSFMAWTKGKKSALTKESARISSKKLRFSNEKLINTLNIAFKPIDQTFKEIAERIK